ncbi:hypothetical protein P280DRAFT_553725 [Massarina eburnea CBS 473.64]|uniref:Uncharacterized protein n=1 Tax=Massarina eburnea CBS 473.64 TaxID=1395130 RepID=A0A6A6RJZ2_9PLEO|nr:hypothetical protein P280DRAFT_553725 [Massarina eburnea CBS 473.64]
MPKIDIAHPTDAEPQFELSQYPDRNHSSKPNELSIETQDDEIDTNLATASTPQPTPAPRLKTNLRTILSLITLLVTVIIGVGTWAGQNYSNRIAVKGNDVAVYGVCMDHEELQSSQTCKNVMAEDIFKRSCDAAKDDGTWKVTMRSNGISRLETYGRD